jgi:glutamine kinase
MKKKLILSSKAKTLEELSLVIKSAKILPIFRFFAIQFEEEKDNLIKTIQSHFCKNIIVRSSSVSEDGLHASNAGVFDSVLNVDVSSYQSIENGINKVLESYGKNLKPKDEIFVQPMVENVTMSGVIFSADIDTLSHYYIINYDESGSTDSVTNGSGQRLKNFICFKNNSCIDNLKIEKLITATKECQKIFDNEFLDIEFAFDYLDLYILQVRAIVKSGKEDLSTIDLTPSLRKLYKKIKKLNSPHPNLLGNKAIFGVMSDWNPAEIIGIKPKKLSLSLYKELITDEIWAYQRDNYGYRNLRSHPLMVSFLGVPYIDVRVSFNSFIPKELDEGVATKLVDYYLSELEGDINNHDKIEFKIIFSCYYFGIDSQLLKLRNFGFNGSDIEKIKQSLLNLTNNIIDIDTGPYKEDLNKAKLLKGKLSNIVESKLPLMDKIYWLIQDVKRYGTLPFAGVARAGFIAIQLLKSFVSEGIISDVEYDKFLNSLNTVSKQLSTDIKILSNEEFLEIYGHLRPGTYDLLSLRYDESYNSYFGDNEVGAEISHDAFDFSHLQILKIEIFIRKSNLKTNFNDLLLFIREAIEGRESVKFDFTRHLSQILKYIEELGSKFDFTKEDLAHLNVQKIINLYATLDCRDVKDILNVDIEKNKEFYNYTKAIKLPSVIVNPEDVYNFFIEESEPSFVTLKQVVSSIVLEQNIPKNLNLNGKIVCIQSADPGYDYLFSKNIGGLITCYGGANSHMAIRCAEMGIPAVIGCGEVNFREYCKAMKVEINSLNGQVKILS